MLLPLHSTSCVPYDRCTVCCVIQTCHGAELPFVFHFTTIQNSQVNFTYVTELLVYVCGCVCVCVSLTAIGHGFCSMTPVEQQLSQSFVDYWTSFAIHGDPNVGESSGTHTAHTARTCELVLTHVGCYSQATPSPCSGRSIRSVAARTSSWRTPFPRRTPRTCAASGTPSGTTIESPREVAMWMSHSFGAQQHERLINMSASIPISRNEKHVVVPCTLT